MSDRHKKISLQCNGLKSFMKYLVQFWQTVSHCIHKILLSMLIFGQKYCFLDPDNLLKNKYTIAWIFHTILCMKVRMLLQKRCLPIIRKDRPFCKYLLIHQTSFFTFMPKGARIVRAPQGGYGLARVRDYARVLWFCSGL